MIAATGHPTLCNPFGVLAAVTSYLRNLLKKNIKCIKIRKIRDFLVKLKLKGEKKNELFIF